MGVGDGVKEQQATQAGPSEGVRVPLPLILTIPDPLVLDIGPFGMRGLHHFFIAGPFPNIANSFPIYFSFHINSIIIAKV